MHKHTRGAHARIRSTTRAHFIGRRHDYIYSGDTNGNICAAAVVAVVYVCVRFVNTFGVECECVLHFVEAGAFLWNSSSTNNEQMRISYWPLDKQTSHVTPVATVATAALEFIHGAQA